jgi:hypothetical protein
MTTLLEKALAVKVGPRAGRVPSAEVVELAIAWAEGRVRLMQLAQALGTNDGSNAYNHLAFALREAWLQRNAKDARREGGK